MKFLVFLLPGISEQDSVYLWRRKTNLGLPLAWSIELLALLEEGNLFINTLYNVGSWQVIDSTLPYIDNFRVLPLSISF